MMKKENLKQKTISGMFWSFYNNILSQFIHFVVGIVLARLLSPSEFGLIGMITVFIAISQSFIDSGFSQALIRKNNASSEDFSTVFYFNLIVGIFFFLILYFSAPLISKFYNQPELRNLTRVLALILVINTFGLIQRTILIKGMNFRMETRIIITSDLISGIFSIILAVRGFGVWSLVCKSIISTILQVILLWYYNKWRPRWIFNSTSFKELFSFGSKLLISGLIETLYRNIYLLVIGKVFSAEQLGYYTKADQFNNLPSKGLTGMVQKVSYPALSMIQDDSVKLKAGYKKVIQSTMFFSFSGMIVLAAVAEPLIIVLIGKKWLASVPYLQLLCFVGMLYPLHALNLNMLNVKGRSDLFLKLEIIKKIFAIPVIIVGILTSIKAMIAGMIFISFVSYFINSYYSGKLIHYNVKEQLLDLYPTFITALINGGVVYSINFIPNINPFVKLMVQSFVGILSLIVISEVSGNKGYVEVKEILSRKLSTVLNGRINRMEE